MSTWADRNAAYVARMRCPEATRHGPADGTGRCPWCRRKFESAMPEPRPAAHWRPSELEDAYREHYDPDYGAQTHDEIRAMYETGRNA